MNTEHKEIYKGIYVYLMRNRVFERMCKGSAALPTMIDKLVSYIPPEKLYESLTDEVKNELARQTLGNMSDTYVANRGEICPWCKARYKCIDVFALHYSDDYDIYREVQCNECGQEWKEVYKLSHILI